MKELYTMKLGERIKYEIYDVFRVPGGWIFACDSSGQGIMNVFVPFNNEFQ